MPERSSRTLAPEILTALPESLRTFLSRKETRIETEDGDWEVMVRMPPARLAKHLPNGAVLIGNNGVGDHIYLIPTAGNAARLDTKVHVYWHEGPETDVMANDIDSLVSPPPPTASTRPPVYYHDGQTVLQLGDVVTARTFFRRRSGRVAYVPGISKKNREMEHGGLCWVAITFPDGTRLGTVVDPKTSRLKKSVRFVRRSTESIGEMGPRERFE